MLEDVEPGYFIFCSSHFQTSLFASAKVGWNIAAWLPEIRVWRMSQWQLQNVRRDLAVPCNQIWQSPTILNFLTTLAILQLLKI
jgi:hypothetical protein